MNESAWIDELIHEIGKRIAAKLDLSPELVHVTGAPVIRRFSITQRFTSNATSKAAPTTLIAKTRRYASKSAFEDAVKEPRTQRLAEQEYETHRKAFEIFSKHDSMSVPDLFDLQKDLATIVMEAIHGESLARSASNVRAAKKLYSKQDLRPPFFQAGVWLRTFHQEIAEQEPLKWKREAIDRIVANHLKALREDGINQRRFDDVTSRFDQRLAEIDNRTSQIFGIIHGDFKPAHVLLDEQQIVVIDFGTTRKEYGAADAGNFLADLACNAFGPRIIRRASLERFISEFSSAYNSNNSEGTGAIVRLYYAMNLLRLWRKRRQRFPNGTPLRKVDKFIDLSKSRGLLNRSYVDRWFEEAIMKVLT